MISVIKNIVVWMIVLFIVMLCIDYATTDTAAANSSLQYRKHIIAVVWGRDAALGVRIAGCESTWNPYAKNGNQLGLFQETPHNRAAYGWGHGAWAQARSGYRLFKDEGTNPWNQSKRCWNG